jgi:hypothetical protein
MKGASFESILADLLRQAGRPARPEYLMLRGEPAPIALVFEQGRDQPACVFKGAHDLSLARGEYAKIAALLEVSSDRFGETIPRPLGTHTGAAGLTGILLSALPGARLKDLPPEWVFGPATIDETLPEITRWLTGFHEVARRLHGRYPPAGRRDLIERPVERYRTWFRVTSGEAARIDAAVDGLPNPGSRGLPHCLAHGDFSPANVLWDDGRIGVVDFEFALEPSLALEDLFHFLASMKSTTRPRDREGQRKRFFAEIFYGRGHLAGAARRAVQALAGNLRVEPELIEHLFVLSWVRLAVRSVELRARELHCEELLDDPDRLWERLDAETDEFLPVSRISARICGNVRQHAEMRDRFVLTQR